MSLILLAIDPGDVYSAFCFIDMETYKPLYFDKVKNDDMFDLIDIYIEKYKYDNSFSLHVACEMISSYGMPVGKSVFETCVLIGAIKMYMGIFYSTRVDYIYRKDEKLCICGQVKAKDSNIRQALIDRFAKFDFKNGKGTKKEPDWFFGFKADVWAAYCVGVTWIDAHNGLYELTQK